MCLNHKKGVTHVMEIFLRTEERPDVDSMAKFLATLSLEKHRDIENFLTGYKFGQEQASTKKTA